jgi:hypothetical protein
MGAWCTRDYTDYTRQCVHTPHAHRVVLMPNVRHAPQHVVKAVADGEGDRRQHVLTVLQCTARAAQVAC